MGQGHASPGKSVDNFGNLSSLRQGKAFRYNFAEHEHH